MSTFTENADSQSWYLSVKFAGNDFCFFMRLMITLIVIVSVCCCASAEVPFLPSSDLPGLKTLLEQADILLLGGATSSQKKSESIAVMVTTR
jgi:hypothetical protein